jgi:hypothetical protein
LPDLGALLGGQGHAAAATAVLLGLSLRSLSLLALLALRGLPLLRRALLTLGLPRALAGLALAGGLIALTALLSLTFLVLLSALGLLVVPTLRLLILHLIFLPLRLIFLPLRRLTRSLILLSALALRARLCLPLLILAALARAALRCALRARALRTLALRASFLPPPARLGLTPGDTRQQRGGSDQQPAPHGTVLSSVIPVPPKCLGSSVKQAWQDAVPDAQRFRAMSYRSRARRDRRLYPINGNSSSWFDVASMRFHRLSLLKFRRNSIKAAEFLVWGRSRTHRSDHSHDLPSI